VKFEEVAKNCRKF